MAQQCSSKSLASFRAITYRISSTPSKQLPPVAAQIAGSIWSCRDVFSAGQQSSKTEAANLVHRFKTTINSLLQDRSIEGRWAAVVFTKSTIEAGGVDTLSKANSWVRSLLAILKKPDPPTTRQLAVITLTRIFMLTWDYSNLVREITTPALPIFISTCLLNVDKGRCSPAELESVLGAFGTLMPRHPTVFRTHERQITDLVTKILSSTTQSDRSILFNQCHRDAARRVCVHLHSLAPKQGGGERWETMLLKLITEAHATCDQLFRSIVEDEDLTASWRGPPTPRSMTGEPGWDAASSFGNPWRGVLAGSERLVDLLEVLRAHLETSATSTLGIRIGSLIALLSRVMSMTFDIGLEPSRANSQTPKDEREALISALPDVHVASLTLIAALVQRFGRASTTFVQNLLELVLGVFNTESSDDAVRLTTYQTIGSILDISGPSMSKQDVAELGRVIRKCCGDLLPEQNNPSTHKSPDASSSAVANGIGTKAESSKSDGPSKESPLSQFAATLLEALITKINPSAMSRQVRVQLERTAVLTRNKNALIACVLNPASKHAGGKLEPSLLPILAREFPDIPEVEALLRPRMPVVVNSRNGEGNNGYEEEVDADYEVSDMGDELAGEHEVSHPIPSLNNQAPSVAEASTERIEDDLYSVTPPKGAQDTANKPGREIQGKMLENLAATKRPAEAELEAMTAPSKRHRGSPIPQPTSVSLSAAPVLPAGQRTGDVQDILNAEVEETDMQGGAKEKSKVAEREVSMTQSGNKGGAEDEMDSEGSDFEMPPLTMEPDTDSEDEEEDEEA